MINMTLHGWYGLWPSATAVLISAILTKIWISPFCKLMQQAGWVRSNYQGRQIPIAAGAVLILSFLATILLLVIWGEASEALLRDGTSLSLPSERQLLLILLLSFGMGMLGILDDLLGSRATGGLKGHFMKWVRDGEITTGLIKAVGGGCLSLTVALLGNPSALRDWNLSSAAVVVVDGLVIALTANWINLLDVRPGRALKAVLLKSGLLLLVVPASMSAVLLPLIGVAIGYFSADLQEKAMMGDVGANFLGAVLGYLLVETFGANVTGSILAVLLLLHVYTETHSLSKLIERNKVLEWLDQLGREEAR